MATNNISNHIFLYGSGGPYVNFMEYESALLVIKGKVLEYSTTLHLVKIVDLSNNNLSEEIPKEVTNLQGLQSLTLSFNILKNS